MYTFFDKLITPERCQELNTVALKLKKENRLNYEADKNHYANSYGTGRIANFEKLLKELTPVIKERTGIHNIVEENSYTRIYYNGATLAKHVDRKGLDLTLSLCTFSNLKKPWELHVQVEKGKVLSFDTKPGDGALILGTKMLHWRDPLICAEDEYVIQSFYHWKINGDIKKVKMFI
jgi:alkylated DNA repair dioxygenase AlkB